MPDSFETKGVAGRGGAGAGAGRGKEVEGFAGEGRVGDGISVDSTGAVV